LIRSLHHRQPLPGITERDTPFLSETKVGGPGGRQVTPADGERYLEGLVLSFRGTRFWAEPDGLRHGDQVSTKTRESGQGDGPEIIILDPNEPDRAYAQLMAQYRRNTERGSGTRTALREYRVRRTASWRSALNTDVRT
jgi:hypothetical protein